MEYKFSLGTAGNTILPTLQVLTAKGYTITRDRTPPEDDDPLWVAVKDERRFLAETVESLLGLIAMWESRGDDWYLKPGEYEQYEHFLYL